jgi:hypothetical protein
MELRIYDMHINANDETGVDINSFVDMPAHLRSFETYGKKSKAVFALDEKKRIVTGVFIMADFLIYRNDKQLGEHFVRFPKETIWDIRNKFFKKGFNVNTNVQHETMVKGAILVESYVVHSSDPRFPKVPEILAHQKVTDGSWVGSYYIENEQLWQDCLNGTFTGFSVEGYFDKIETTIKTNKQINTNSMKGKHASKAAIFMKNIFGADSVEETMSEATTVDGVILFYDGDLAVGTAVMIEVNGERVAAPEGDHQVDIDGTAYALSIDSSGVVTSMEEVTAMSEDATLMSMAIKKIVEDASSKFASMQKQIDQLKSDLTIAQSGGKFTPAMKKSVEGDSKNGFRKALA